MHKIVRVIAFSCFCFSLAACGSMAMTGEKMSTLNPGDSLNKAITVVGKPDGFERLQDGTIAYKYINRHISGWDMKTTDYYLVFKDGKLMSVVNGPLRDNSQQIQNSINAFNNRLENQEQRSHESRMKLMDSLNQNKAQRVILCKQGDFMCY